MGKMLRVIGSVLVAGVTSLYSLGYVIETNEAIQEDTGGVSKKEYVQ